MGIFQQALIDPATGELIVNGLYYVYLNDGTTLATVFSDAEHSLELSQPLSTSASGNAFFHGNGGYYKLSRGGEQIDIQIPDDPAQALVDAIANLTSIDFVNACYISGSFGDFTETTVSFAIPTPSPHPQAIFYRGSDDIQITWPGAQVSQNAVWEIYNLGTGSIEVLVTSPGTLVNVNGHTKIAGQGAVGFVTQTKDPTSEDPEYVLGGITSA